MKKLGDGKSLEDCDFHKDGIHVQSYNSYTEMIAASNWIGEIGHGGLKRGSQVTENKSFSGTNSFEEAYILATQGWVDGAKKLALNNDDNEEKQKFAITENRCHIEYGHSGQYVDVSRFVSGVPECMVNITHLHIPKRIKIIVKIGFNAGASEEDFFKYGQKIISIVDYFERRNIRVKLITRMITHNDGKQSVIQAVMKRYEEFMDINKLAFVFCHPSFLRRIIFSIEERMERKIVDYFDTHAHGNYGRIGELIVSKHELRTALCIESENVGNFDDLDKINHNFFTIDQDGDQAIGWNTNVSK